MLNCYMCRFKQLHLNATKEQHLALYNIHLKTSKYGVSKDDIDVFITLQKEILNEY